MVVTMSTLGVSLYTPNGVLEEKRFLIVVLLPSTGPEDDFSLLKSFKVLKAFKVFKKSSPGLRNKHFKKQVFYLVSE